MEALQNPKCLKQPKVSLPMWIKTVVVLNLGRLSFLTHRSPTELQWRALGQGLALCSLFWQSSSVYRRMVHSTCITLMQVSRICVVFFLCYMQADTVLNKQLRWLSQVLVAFASAPWVNKGHIVLGYMCSFCTSKNDIVPSSHMKAKSCEGLNFVLRSLVNQRCSASKWDSWLLETETWFSMILVDACYVLPGSDSRA